MRLSFVELKVRDVAASAAWYGEALGLPVLTQDGDAFALLDAGAARIALKVGEPAPGGALLALEVDDLDAWVARLGGHVEGPVKSSAEGYRRARLRDPDGYEVVLFEWPAAGPQSAEEV